MLVSDLITRVREDYLDDTLGVDTNDSLVSEAALIRFTDEAQKEACRRMDMLYDETTELVCKISYLTGGNGFLLDNRITVLERVMLSGIELTHKTEAEIKTGNAAWMTYTGPPTCYYIKQRTIYLHPIPESAGDLDLAVYRLPMEDVNNTAGFVLEIPEEFQIDLINWVLWRVYNKRDEDVFNPQDAALFLDRFEQVFGKTVPADVRLHRFESPRIQTLRPAKGYSFTGNNNQDDPDFDSNW